MTQPQEIGCLLLHGFTSSPTEMAGLEAYLIAKGYTVCNPRLPGHATRPEDLFHVTHRDWISASESALREIQSRTKRQIVIGLSMGGALALHLAANFKFEGVVALAPALRLPAWKQSAVYLFGPVMKMFKKPNGPDVNDQQGKLLLDSYNEYPMVAAKELLRLQQQVRAELPNITMPLLVIHSKQDHTIPVSNLQYLVDRVRSAQIEKIILDRSYHILTVDYDRDAIFERIEKFIATYTA